MHLLSEIIDLFQGILFLIRQIQELINLAITNK